MGERVDDRELERLAGAAAELLVGLPGTPDGVRGRDEFVRWFERHGLDGFAMELAVAGPATEDNAWRTELWRDRLREAILAAPGPLGPLGRPGSPGSPGSQAADELRSIVDKLDRPDPTPLRTPESGDLLDFRESTFHGQVIGVQTVHNSYAAPAPDGAQPPSLDWLLAKDVEPLTHGVRPTRRVRGLPVLPPYVRRDQDGAVNSAVEQARSESGLVVVLGQAYVGKSRAALAAMAQVLPDHRVFAPARDEDLRELPALLRGRAERCVVWLDDLDGHLGGRGLEPRLLAQLSALEAVVLATMRDEAYDKCVGTSAQGRLLDLAQLVELPRTWSPAELERAERTGDPRLTEAVRESGTVGVATYLAIGHRLWNDWRRARNPQRHPRAHALVRAAVDLARCGLTGPLPRDLLVTVHDGYGIAGLERESLDDAWEWAGRRRYGSLRMLRCSDREPRPFEDVLPYAVRAAARSDRETGPFGNVLPYFVHTAEQDDGFPAVAGWVWGQAVEAARADPSAYDVESVVAGARAAYAKEAEAGDGSAMHALGLLEESLGEGEKAESWFRRAAEAGWTESAGRLGRLLVERGESREAESFLESAAEAGDHEAATLLGKLLRDRAAVWFEAAKKSGNPEAAHCLGDLLLADGDADGADDCYLTAEQQGYAGAARSAGVYHLLANAPEIARVWLERAAAAGDDAAAGLLLDMEGETEGLASAEGYFSVSDTYPLDNTHHGVVLEKLGRLDEARKDYEKGYAADDPYAAYRLAVLLEEQGDGEEAGVWYRKAAVMGHPAARKAVAGRPGAPDTVKE
ncbi:hypothetical protein [Streptomyces sp. NPDC096142]|uniref:hypothetical protein n=1 Tax=Streptomyces sp. NPDC096142 TaxID=3366077 RepID=UPI0037FA31A9